LRHRCIARALSSITILAPLVLGVGAPAHGQTVVQVNGNGSNSVGYSVFNDFSGIIEGLVTGGALFNSGTFTGPTGSGTTAFPLGSATTLGVSDIDLLPAGYLSGSTVVQPLAGSGTLTLDVSNPQNGTATLLSAKVAGGDIFGAQGSSTATFVFDLSSLSSSVLSSVPASSAYLELTGTTSAPLALSLQCYGLSGLSGCHPGQSQSELALNSLQLNWSTGEVTTTAPTIPTSGPRQVQFINGNSGLTNLSWGSSTNWQANNTPTTPQPGDNVFLTNPSAVASQSPVIVNYDATNIDGSQGALNSLTIDSNAGGALLQLSQAANTLASGNETIGTTGTAEHLQTGGINTVSGTLTLNGFGTYDLQGGTLKADTIAINNGGKFWFDGGNLAGGSSGVTAIALNDGGAVAAGSAANPGDGTGTEIIQSSTTTIQLAATGGVLTSITGATSLTQTGISSTNLAGSILLGQDAGTVGIYNLQSGSVKAGSETIGGGLGGGEGLFWQSGGTNTVGTLTVQSGNLPGTLSITPAGCTLLCLGQQTNNPSGGYMLTGGTLMATSETINMGAFTQSAGTNTMIGALTLNTIGTYDLNGGALTALTIAVNPGGSLNLDGGALNFATMTIAGATSGFAAGNPVAAVTASGDEDLANSTVTQSGMIASGAGSSSNTVSGNLVIGTSAGTTATYNLQGGTLSATNEIVGQAGTPLLAGLCNGLICVPSSGATGTLTQSGGSNFVSGTLTLAQNPGASGTYDLQGGTLTAGTIAINPGGTFKFDGGTASFSTMTIAGATSGFAAGNPVAAVTASGDEVIGTSANPNSVIVQRGTSSNTVSGNLQVNGAYMLQGGLVSAPSETITGQFNQSGGTNTALAELTVNGTYSLTGGTLNAFSAAAIDGNFTQSGASVFNPTLLLIGTNGIYNFQGGTLSSVPVLVNPGGLLEWNNSTVSIPSLVIEGGGPGSSVAAVTASGDEIVDGLVIQIGTSSNTVSGNLQVNGAYMLQGGTVTAAAGETINGQFNQSGTSSNSASTVGVDGAYALAGGQLDVVLNLDVNGSLTQSGASSLKSAVINIDGTYTLQGGTVTAALGNVNPGGLLELNGGTANIQTLFLAGATTGFVAGDPVAAVTASGNEVIGSASNPNSTIVQTGTIDPASGVGSSSNTVMAALRLGTDRGSIGTYDLMGGTVSASQEALGIAIGGTGIFNQSGGTNTVSGELDVGINGNGTYNLSGGTLSAARETVGQLLSTGTFMQTGGTNTVGSLTLGTASYTLSSGGTLTAGTITVDRRGTLSSSGALTAETITVNSGGSFNQTGGAATVSGNVINSGSVTINGAGVVLTVDGSYTQSGAGSETLLNGGTLDPTSVNIEAGTFGGTGTVVGDVTLTDATLQVGASPDPLHIIGNYAQTGGDIIFEIDPDGHGGYLESTLVFDPGNSVLIADANITFDFLNGADALAFFDSGAFNLDAFFQESNGSLFSAVFDLPDLFATDSFSTNEPGVDITGFNAAGAVTVVQNTASVPEPPSGLLLLPGLGMLGAVLYRKRGCRSSESRRSRAA
jgi:hypothetical protein